MLNWAINRRQVGILSLAMIVVSVTLFSITRSNASSTPRDLPANQTIDSHFLQQQRQRRQFVRNLNNESDNLILPVARELEQSGASRHGEQLHFGAKVAIFLLIATILLVASATLVDLNQKQTNDTNYVNATGFLSQEATSRQPSNQLYQHQHQHHQQQQHHSISAANSFQQQNQEQLRDQRSPSLSSSSSSSIFCSSANSVASACIPILSGHQRCNSNVSRKQQQHKQQLAQQEQEVVRSYNNAWFRFKLQTRHAKLQEQYEQSLHMNLNVPHGVEVSSAEQTNNTTDTAAAGITTNQDHQSERDGLNSIRQRERNLLESVKKAERWQHCNDKHLEDNSFMKFVSGSEAVHHNHNQTINDRKTSLSWLNRHLFKQLFLAFSLRHSASLIFHQSENQTNRRVNIRVNRSESSLANCETISSEKQSNAQQAMQQQVGGHRLRVSSLSSDIHQTTLPTSCDSEAERNQTMSYSTAAYFSSSSSSSDCDESPISSQQQATMLTSQTTLGEDVSIDSLHGLKFLSMIWIIVVHSYSLATRWSFFTDNSTPTNIYTSVASQLLSNGTFACDSFFFTGGFLLAYLAFPFSSPSTAAQQQAPAPRSEAASFVSPTSPALSVSAQSAQVEPQFQIVSVQQQQQKVLQTTTTTLTATKTDNLTAEDSSKLKDGSKQANSCSCVVEEGEGIEFNEFNSPSINGAASPQLCCCYFCSPSYKQQQPLKTDSSKHTLNTCSPITSQIVVAMAPHENQENNNIYERNLHQQQQQQQYQHHYHHQQQQQVSFITNNSNKNGQQNNTLNNKAPHRNHLGSVENYSTNQDNKNNNNNSNLLEQNHLSNLTQFTVKRLICNLVHRYIRMMPLMMAIIGLSATLLRYLGDGPAWNNSTLMFDKWCRNNWWINSLFLHNFVNRENMCLSHSWYSAVDIQLYLIGQIILFVLFRNRKIGILICCFLLIVAPVITATLTLIYNLPAVPLTISSVSEKSLNIYYGEIYIKPYCRAAPYLIGILLAYLMRTTSLGQIRLKKWQVIVGWTASLSVLLAILLAMQPAMNGQPPSELVSALYSALSRPFWACATGWMIFACITKHGGIFDTILSAKCFVPFSRLTYPAFLIHPIVMAIFYGSRPERSHFSHYLMLYLILGHIVITYSSAFVLSALFELPLLSVERVIKRALSCK